MKDWQEYLRKGLVKKQRPNFAQIEQQIIRAEKDLKTFGLVIDSDPEWACTIAYQAMLRMGRALMFSYGYLPVDGQPHKTVVEITGKLWASGARQGRPLTTHLIRITPKKRRRHLRRLSSC